MGLYSKLKRIGHGRLESLCRAIGYRVQSAMPFPSYEPIEFQIEEHLFRLEDLATSRYRPFNNELTEDAKRKEIDKLVGYLDSQLQLDDRTRFSAAQIKRYETLLDRLGDKYSGQ